jgi:hypothetical protein
VRMATSGALRSHDRAGGARNVRSEVGKLTPSMAVGPAARHGGWRFPHRSRREIAVLVLFWFVVAVGLAMGAVYIAGQQR